jgi:hypothetical protein
VKGLLSGFQHFFGNPMVGVVEELCGLVEYSADRSMIRAQLRSIHRGG